MVRPWTTTIWRRRSVAHGPGRYQRKRPSCCRSRTQVARARRSSIARSSSPRWKTRFQKAAKSRYGTENDIRCEIDPRTGETKSPASSRWSRRSRRLDPRSTSRAPSAASPTPRSGGRDHRDLPPLDFGRVAAQNAKQVIVCRRCARPSANASTTSTRIASAKSPTATGQACCIRQRHRRSRQREGIIRRDEMIPRESPRLGDRIPRLHLRRAPRAARPADFPVARQAGIHGRSCSLRKCQKSTTASSDRSRCPRSGLPPKIAVTSKDKAIDPVGACVGNARPARAAGRRRRAAGREGRYLPVSRQGRCSDVRRERAGARRSGKGLPRRTIPTASKSWCMKASCRLPSAARPERAPCIAAYRLGHRHSHRAGRERAPAVGIRRTFGPCSWKHSTLTR